MGHNHNELIGKFQPDDETLMKLEDFYGLFSSVSKLKIIWALYKGEMCVIELAKLIGKTKSAVSHQLKYLKEQNLIVSEKVGKEVFYKLADEHITQIFEIALEHISEV